METMTICIMEYRDLAEKSAALEAKINAFARYVQNSEYAIDRGICGAILGFEVEDVSEH